MIPLFRDAYPDIDFVTHEQVRAERYYATYSVGLFFDDKDLILNRAISGTSACIGPPATFSA